MSLPSSATTATTNDEVEDALDKLFDGVYLPIWTKLKAKNLVGVAHAYLTGRAKKHDKATQRKNLVGLFAPVSSASATASGSGVVVVRSFRYKRGLTTVEEDPAAKKQKGSAHLEESKEIALHDFRERKDGLRNLMNTGKTSGYYYVEVDNAWQLSSLEDILSGPGNMRCAFVEQKEDIQHVATFTAVEIATDVGILADTSRTAETALLYVTEQGLNFQEAAGWTLPWTDEHKKLFEEERKRLSPKGAPEPTEKATDKKESPVQAWLDVDVPALNACRDNPLVYINDSGSSHMNHDCLELILDKGPLYKKITWTNAKIDGLLAEQSLLKDGKYHFGSIRLVFEAKRHKSFVTKKGIDWSARVLQRLAEFDNRHNSAVDTSADISVDISVEWSSLRASSSAKVCIGQCAQRFLQKVLEAVALKRTGEVTQYAVATDSYYAYFMKFVVPANRMLEVQDPAACASRQVLLRKLCPQVFMTKALPMRTTTAKTPSMDFESDGFAVLRSLITHFCDESSTWKAMAC